MKLNLPHSGEMVLIDEILSYGSDAIEVSALVRDSAFAHNQELATYKMIEMMAQSLGAFKGLHTKDAFNLGFLIGAREFEIFTPSVNVGERVMISSKVSMQDESGFGVWDSEIYLGKSLIARATLSVLSPSKQMFLEMKDA